MVPNVTNKQTPSYLQCILPPQKGESTTTATGERIPTAGSAIINFSNTIPPHRATISNHIDLPLLSVAQVIESIPGGCIIFTEDHAKILDQTSDLSETCILGLAERSPDKLYTFNPSPPPIPQSAYFNHAAILPPNVTDHSPSIRKFVNLLNKENRPATSSYRRTRSFDPKFDKDFTIWHDRLGHRSDLLQTLNHPECYRGRLPDPKDIKNSKPDEPCVVR